MLFILNTAQHCPHVDQHTYYWWRVYCWACADNIHFLESLKPWRLNLLLCLYDCCVLTAWIVIRLYNSSLTSQKHFINTFHFFICRYFMNYADSIRWTQSSTPPHKIMHNFCLKFWVINYSYLKYCDKTVILLLQVCHFKHVWHHVIPLVTFKIEIVNKLNLYLNISSAFVSPVRFCGHKRATKNADIRTKQHKTLQQARV